MKRIVSLVLCIVLLLGVAVPVMADGSNKAISVNKDITDSLQSKSEEDVFTFSLKHNGLMELQIKYNASGGYRLKLYRMTDEGWRENQSAFFYSSSNSAGMTVTKSANRIRVPAGEYKLVVLYTDKLITDNYTVRVNFTDEYGGPYEIAPNAEAYNATALTLNKTIYGNLDDSEDIDYFKFTLNDYGYVDTRLRYDPDGGYRLTLYYLNEGGQLSKYEDTFFYTNSTTATDTIEKAMTPMRLWPGTFYLKVNKNDKLSNEDYAITVNYKAEPTSNFEREPNDKGNQANLIDTNRSVTGNLYASDCSDFYKVVLSSADTLRTQLQYDASAGYTVRLYSVRDDGSLKQMEATYCYSSSSASGLLTKTGEAVSCPAGTYFIEVKSSDFTSNDYTLTVKADRTTTHNPAVWAEQDVNIAIDKGLVPDQFQDNYGDKITRGEFCTLAVTMLCTKEGKTVSDILAERGLTVDYSVFTDTSDYNILAAYALDLVSGRGNGIFDPYGAITRQEAAAMLGRTANALGLYKGNAPAMSFTDTSSIASWATESVFFVSSILDEVSGSRVMAGMADGSFSPRTTYTREQSFLTMLRLFHAT